MRQITEDLWQSDKYSSGRLYSHAYLLVRPAGNVLFYNTAAEADLAQAEALGGVRYQLLTHRDESGPSLQRIRQRFGSELGCSVPEASYIGRDCQPDLVFSPLDSALEDIQIIHTPGHTDGSITFLYCSPYGQTYLFTGDTYFQSYGQWQTFVMQNAGGTEKDMAESLEKLRQLQPDLVMSSGFVGDVAYREVTRANWAVAIDQTLEALSTRRHDNDDACLSCDRFF